MILPREFSYTTKQAIKTGVVTKASRIEIISAMATRVVQQTRTPTPVEYQTLCRKLVLTYPTLQDPFGNGYVSLVYTIVPFTL